jgi:hypothetical protein
MNFLKKALRSKTLIICVAVLVLYTLAGFFLASWLVRHYVPKIIQGERWGQSLNSELCC